MNKQEFVFLFHQHLHIQFFVCATFIISFVEINSEIRCCHFSSEENIVMAFSMICFRVYVAIITHKESAMPLHIPPMPILDETKKSLHTTFLQRYNYF